MSQDFHEKVDAERKRIDLLDQKEDKKFDVADENSSIFQGVDNFKGKLVELKVPFDRQQEYLGEILGHLETVVGPENVQAVVDLLDLQLAAFEQEMHEWMKFQEFAADHIRTRSKAVVMGVRIEHQENAETQLSEEQLKGDLAHPSVLRGMIENFGDTDILSGDSDREERLVSVAVEATAQKLEATRAMLAACPDKNAPEYKAIEALYAQDVALYAEIMVNTGDSFENPLIRDPKRAGQFVDEAISRMDMHHAVQWVEVAMRRIDANNWQSKGLQEAYGVFGNTCRTILQQKLLAERAQTQEGDAEGIRANFQKTIQLAELFTGRGGDIDSALCSPDWAAELLRGVINFEEMAVGYIERNFESTENPLTQKIDTARAAVKEKLAELPDETRNNPDVVEWVTQAETMLKARPNGIKEQAIQLGTLKTIEATLNGEDPPDMQQDIAEVKAFVAECVQGFGEFIDSGAWGKGVGEIAAATGVSFTVEQADAYKLLGDIEGFGTLDFSDKTWATAAEVAKITGMIVGGIAIGLVTGGAGLGVVGAALVGGAGMTAINAAMYQRGFDDMGEVAKVYGTDLAVGTATFGAARYLQAGRAALQLRNAGLLQQGGTRQIMQLATRGGGRWTQLMSMDDAFTLGNRLVGGLAEGAVDYAIGGALDATTMSIQEGGSFLTNLGEALKNPMNIGFIGGGIGLEFSPSAWKAIKEQLGRSDPQTLHGLQQSLQQGQTARAGLMDDFQETGLSWQQIAQGNPEELIQRLPADHQEAVREHFQQLRAAQQDFQGAFVQVAEQAGVDIDPLPSAPQSTKGTPDADIARMGQLDAEGRPYSEPVDMDYLVLPPIVEKAGECLSEADAIRFREIMEIEDAQERVRKMMALRNELIERHIDKGTEMEVETVVRSRVTGGKSKVSLTMVFTGEMDRPSSKHMPSEYVAIDKDTGETYYVNFHEDGELGVYTDIGRIGDSSISRIKDKPELEHVLGGTPTFMDEAVHIVSNSARYGTSIEAKEPKGNFEPVDEMARIRKMPRGSEKLDAIRRAKEQRDIQRVAIGEVPEKVRAFLRDHPDAHHTRVWEHVLGEGQWSQFSRDQRIEIKGQIKSYTEKWHAVRHYATEYKDNPKALAARIFDIPEDELEGKFEIRVDGASLFFNVENPKTFALLAGVPRYETDAVGFATTVSNIPELKGTINVGKNREGLEYERTVRHEGRHQENKQLMPKTPEIVTRRHEVSPESGKRRKNLVRAKDEIISFMTDGRSKETVIAFLTEEGGVYDYYQMEIDWRQNLQKEYKEGIRGRGRWADTQAETLTRWVDEYDTMIEGAREEKQRHFDRVKRMAEFAYQVGSENVDLLTVTPFERWPQLARATRVIEDQRVISREGLEQVITKPMKKTAKDFDRDVRELQRAYDAGDIDPQKYTEIATKLNRRIQETRAIWEKALPYLIGAPVWEAAVDAMILLRDLSYILVGKRLPSAPPLSAAA